MLFWLAAISPLIALMGCGGSASAKPPVTLEPTLVFSASINTITSGQTVMLSWQTTNADSVTITATGADGSTRQIPTNSQLNGSTPDKPLQNTTYAATASGPGGSAQQQAKVAVNQPLPTLTFSADTTTIVSGATVHLSWQMTNATSIAITAMGADGVKRQISTAQNPAPDQPTDDTTYTAVATGPGGSTPPQTVSVMVALGAAQITQFSASPTTVVADASTTLTLSLIHI